MASDVREIPLTRGYVALVDAADYEWLAAFKWCASVNKRGTLVYAVRGVGGRAKARLLSMHRLILGDPAGLLVDHANGNTLDNRRCNLRSATSGQNNANRRSAGCAAGYRGVVAGPKPGTWAARLNGHLGIFDSAEAAALAFDFVARNTYGEFAVLNFPDRVEAMPQKRAQPTGASGLRGVVPTRGGRWRAIVHRNNRQINLGTFDAPEAAAAARASALAQKTYGL